MNAPDHSPLTSSKTIKEPGRQEDKKVRKERKDTESKGKENKGKKDGKRAKRKDGGR